MGKKEQVAIIGSGNWGTAISRIIGHNTRQHGDVFEDKVRMWVFEETLPDGRKLSQVINEEHENVKYLPDITLPENVVAITELPECVAEASMLVFVTPHQFIKKICGQIRGLVGPNTKAISLVKGVEISEGCGNKTGSTGNIRLISEIIREELELTEVLVMMGANIANEVAKEQFCESTLGYHQDLQSAKIFKLLLQAPYFRINIVQDIVGVELCGALKNIIALGAGFVDGMDLGENTKAAVVRLGLQEMRQFCKMYNENVRAETFWESCGIADLITTCYGGRNRKVAEAMVRTHKSVDELEAELLNGQKLQGPPTAQEVFKVLECQGRSSDYPLMTSIYRICFEQAPPHSLIEALTNINN